MSKFSIIQAIYGYDNSDPYANSFSYGNDTKPLFVDITTDVNSVFQTKGMIKINSFEKGFGSDLYTITYAESVKFNRKIQDPNPNPFSKLLLTVLNDDTREIEGKYFFSRENGWQKKDKNNRLIDSNSDNNNVVVIFSQLEGEDASISSDLPSLTQKIGDKLGSLVDKAKRTASDLANKAKQTIGGASTTSGGGASGTTPEVPSDSIVYNEHNSKRVRQLQRCLIRTAPNGNYIKEKQSSAGYTPVVGVRKRGSGNYADDGWFGPATLAAIEKYKEDLNRLNTGNTDAQILDTKAIPVALLASAACKDKMDINPTDKEKQEGLAASQSTPSTVAESKVYTQFSFLSNKNAKLHSVLMEQLKKDLKRG